MDMRSAIRVVRGILGHPCNRDHKVAAAYRVLHWQVASRIQDQGVVCEYVNNSKLLVRRGMSAAIANVYNGISEFEEMAFVLHALRAGDKFVDVGANVGTFSILAALTGAHVLAFEPVPASFAGLSANVALNGLEALVEARQAGIASQRGELQFTTDADTTNHVARSHGPHTKATTVSVPVASLDEVLESAPPTMIKIDVEGFETEVLRGAQATLANTSLMAIVIELNGSGGWYGYDEKQLHTMLLDSGFRAFDYEPRRRELTEVTWETHARANVLYLRDLQWARNRVSSAPAFRVCGQTI